MSQPPHFSWGRNSSCYSGGESWYNDPATRIKLKVYRPILLICRRFGITPNMITLAGLFFGTAAGCALAFGYLWTTFVLLLIHVVLDGIDGTLAKFVDNSSIQGSVFDISSDMISVFFLVVGLVHLNLLDSILALWFIFVYLSIVVFSIVRNVFNRPYKNMLRPRYELYLVFVLYLFFGIDIFDISVLIFNIIMTVTFVTGLAVVLSCLGEVGVPSRGEGAHNPSTSDTEQPHT